MLMFLNNIEPIIGVHDQFGECYDYSVFPFIRLYFCELKSWLLLAAAQKGRANPTLSTGESGYPAPDFSPGFLEYNFYHSNGINFNCDG